MSRLTSTVTQEVVYGSDVQLDYTINGGCSLKGLGALG